MKKEYIDSVLLNMFDRESHKNKVHFVFLTLLRFTARVPTFCFQLA